MTDFWDVVGSEPTPKAFVCGRKIIPGISSNPNYKASASDTNKTCNVVVTNDSTISGTHEMSCAGCDRFWLLCNCGKCKYACKGRGCPRLDDA